MNREDKLVFDQLQSEPEPARLWNDTGLPNPFPDVNTKIYLLDNITYHGYRAKPFNWLQRKFILIFFGWKTESF